MAKNAKTLNDLFEDTLKDIFYAENKILKALPKMAKAAHSEELTRAFQKHLKETEGQVSRLEKVFGACRCPGKEEARRYRRRPGGGPRS